MPQNGMIFAVIEGRICSQVRDLPDENCARQSFFVPFRFDPPIAAGQACVQRGTASWSDHMNELHLPPDLFRDTQRGGMDRWKALVSRCRTFIRQGAAFLR
jgi:hypothetical protein